MLAQVCVGDDLCHVGCEHGADVDGHVEEAEGSVTPGGVFGVVVEVAHKHLQVALEKAGADGDECQSTKHDKLAGGVGRGGHGEAEVAQEHDTDADDDALAIANLVGHDASYKGHEIDSGKENGIYLAGSRLIPTKLCLHEKGENGQHGVVAKPLARVGQRQRIKTLRLSFKHNDFLF